MQRVGEGITVTLPEALLFSFDSEQLKAGARERLRRFAASLKRHPNTRTLIVDHTDTHGRLEHDIALSNRRALSAARFISSEGVDRTRICTAGRGGAEPLATSASHAARRLNRREEIAVYVDEAPRSAARN